MLGEICWKFNPFTYICICIYVHEMIGQTSSVCCVLRKQGWRVSQVFGHFEIVAGQLIISRFSLWWHRWNWVGTGELFPLTSIFQRRTWWWADRSRKGTRNCNLQTSAWKKTVKDGFHQAFVRILAATNTTISMVKVEACSETGETGPPELTKHSTPQRPSDYNFQTFRLLVQRYAEKKHTDANWFIVRKTWWQFLEPGYLIRNHLGPGQRDMTMISKPRIPQTDILRTWSFQP